MVHSYGASFVFFNLPYWFIFTGHGLYCFIARFTGHGIYMFTSLTGSSLLDMICTVALPSLVHHYWAWFVLFHFMLHWFFITGHGLCWFTSSFTCSSSMGMICTASLPSLVDHYWQGLYCSTSLTGSSLLNMICIYHFKLHLGFYSFNSRFTGSSLLGMVYIVSLHTLLVPPYWWRFVLFHFPH
jgi:hypothetical protein